MTRLSASLLLLTCIGLTACISGKTAPDTYTDQSGKTTLIQSDREQCESACNASYERCMDTEPAQSNPVPGSPSGMFGASADCRNDLQNCLPSCKSR